MERLEVFENMVLSGNSQWKSTGPPSKGFVLGYLIKNYLFSLIYLFNLIIHLSWEQVAWSSSVFLTNVVSQWVCGSPHWLSAGVRLQSRPGLSGRSTRCMSQSDPKGIRLGEAQLLLSQENARQVG